MAYLKIEGERRGSIVYVHNDFLYTNFRETDLKKVVRCRDWKKSNCKGMGFIRKNDDRFITTIEHSHNSDVNMVSILKMKSEMKTRAEGTNEPLRRIFDQVCSSFPEDVATRISFNQVENTLYKRRRSVEPTLPRSALESGEILLTRPELCDAYNCHITADENGFAILFHTNTEREMVDGHYNCAIDGTFKVAPRYFKQVLVVHILKTVNGKTHPFPLFIAILLPKVKGNSSRI